MYKKEAAAKHELHCSGPFVNLYYLNYLYKPYPA